MPVDMDNWRDVVSIHSMRWLVLRLCADFFFRPDNLTEAIAVIRLETFIASRHSSIAGGQ